MLHAELVSDVANATCGAAEACDRRAHGTWAATRPPQFEVDAARAVVAALATVRERHAALWANATESADAPAASSTTSFGVHIAHVASAEAVQVYLEVCAPCHLCPCSSSIMTDQYADVSPLISDGTG
jgi:hypothetical protein